MFFLVFILCVTRLFVVNTKFNITLGILAISYKGYTSIVY
jgi:hypothetical protein